MGPTSHSSHRESPPSLGLCDLTSVFTKALPQAQGCPHSQVGEIIWATSAP